MCERKTNAEATTDPKITELFEAGRDAFRQREDLDELEIHFDDADRFWIELKSTDPWMVAEEVLQDLSDLQGYFSYRLRLDYAPKERVGAYIRGFGVEAATQGDLRTAISVLDAIADSKDLVRMDLQRTLLEHLNQP